MITNDTTPSISLSDLVTVTGGFSLKGALGKAVKAIPGVSAATAVVSGIKAARSFAEGERAHGYNPSKAAIVGAGALNAGSTFIDNSLGGVPGLIVDATH